MGVTLAQACGNWSARSRQPFRATLKLTVWNCKMVICSLRTVASTCEGVVSSFGQTANSVFQSSASCKWHICWLYKITSDNSDRLPTSTAVLDANHILVYQTPRRKESGRTKKCNTLSSTRETKRHGATLQMRHGSFSSPVQPIHSMLAK